MPRRPVDNMREGSARLGREPGKIYVGLAADLCERARREPKVVEDMLKARVAPAAITGVR